MFTPKLHFWDKTDLKNTKNVKEWGAAYLKGTPPQSYLIFKKAQANQPPSLNKGSP